MTSSTPMPETNGGTKESDRCERDCPRRQPGCHAWCPTYAKQREKFDKIAVARKKEQETYITRQCHYRKTSDEKRRGVVRNGKTKRWNTRQTSPGGKK